MMGRGGHIGTFQGILLVNFCNVKSKAVTKLVLGIAFVLILLSLHICAT